MALQTQTKYRIVGAVVLISALIILVPLFLEPPSNVPAPLRGEQIPTNPHQDLFASVEFNPQDFAAPSPTMPLKEPEVREEINVEGASTKREAEAAALAPVPDTDAAQEARAPLTWWVQLGVFAQEVNASGLRDKLRAKKLSTHVDAINSQDGVRWRVMVGPELSRNRAVALRDQLAQDTTLHGVIVKRQ
ncbi:MAG: SPOR domain-containing protein [Pseudomonadota bacterium]